MSEHSVEVKKKVAYEILCRKIDLCRSSEVNDEVLKKYGVNYEELNEMMYEFEDDLKSDRFPHLPNKNDEIEKLKLIIAEKELEIQELKKS